MRTLKFSIFAIANSTAKSSRPNHLYKIIRKYKKLKYTIFVSTFLNIERDFNKLLTLSELSIN